MLSRHATLAPSRSASKPVPCRRSVVVHGAPISSNDFKNGVAIEIDNTPYKVVEFLHVKPGKGAAFVRTKLKNCLTGGAMEKTFRAGEMVNSADLVRRDAQFTYVEGDEYVFMDQETFEETRLVREEEWAGYLVESAICSLLFYNGKVISVEPPQFVDLVITDTPPNVKGNTASGAGTKTATLETGATITVPGFIEAGTKIKVDTRTGVYLSKSTDQS